MNKFKPGDVVYFIESSIYIKEGIVLSSSGGFTTIRFEQGNSGPAGIRLRDSKLYKTKQEAEQHIRK